MKPDPNMQVYKSIIIDDDPLAGVALQHMIDRSKGLECIQYFSKPYEALAFIHAEKPDVLFLDVEMPEINGLEFISLLHNPSPIILVSMDPHYAAYGFDLNVLDFLRKPISYIRLQQSINRIKEHYSRTKASTFPAFSDYVYVKDHRNQQWIRLAIAEIVWIEAQGDYVTIHTLTKRYTVYTSMKKLLNRLPKEQFARVHRSYIVQLTHIEAIEDNTLCLQNKLIPVGGAYAKTLFERLNMI